MDQNPFEQKIRQANERLRAQSVPETAVLIVVLVCALLLCVASLAATSVIDPQAYQSGNVLFAKDSSGFNFAVLLLLAAAARVLRAARISERFLRRSTVLLLTLLGGVGLLWILLEKALPAGDQLVCYNAAKALVHGDTSALTDENGAFFFFFACSPNRFGTLFYTEVLMRVFGEKGILLAAPALNVLLVLFGYVLLLRLTENLFKDRRIALLTLFFLCIFFQPILSCTVIDGAAFAFALSAWALERTFLYLRNGKKRELAGAAVLFLFAALFRPFALAAAGAVVLALLLAAFRKRSWVPLAAGVVVAAAAVIGLFFPRVLYEARLSTDYGGGLNAVVWRAAERSAGETENMEEIRAYFNEQKEEYGLDFAAFAEQAEADLAAEEQTGAGSASEWLARRISAVWNEPTFGSLWASGAFEPFGERSELALSISGGTAAQALNRAWNQLMQLLYAGVFLSAILLMMQKSEGKMLLPAAVLFGVIFCLFSGPSAGNAVWFLPLLCPLAALGVFAFGVDVTALFTRPSTTWEQAKQERGSRKVK
ncbi:MAG TPA: hypothetical protein P5075_02435 [Eubacteriales bacterium]|nr:hypothetical protein [Eubacteriales bacterium]